MKSGQFDIADRSVRRELPDRADPYWLTFSKHHSIGFSKKRGWTWFARIQWKDGQRRKKQIGLTADSPNDLPNLERMTFDVAMGKVRVWCSNALAEGQSWEQPKRGEIEPPPSRGSYTVQHAFWDWLAWRDQVGLPMNAPKATYRRYLRNELAALPLSQLEQRDILHWRDEIASTPAWNATRRFPHINDVEIGSALFESIRRRRRTANCHLMALKNALDHAHLHGLIDDSIGWRGVKLLPQIGRYEPLILTKEEIEKLVLRVKEPVALLLQSIWYSGARIGEITTLTSERVLADFHKIIVLDSKKGSARGIALTDEGSRFFAAQAQGKAFGDSLFTNHLGKRWTVQRAGNELRKEIQRLEIAKPITFRCFRSSYSSYLIAAGVPPAVVARQLGHHSSLTTELYYGHIGESAIDTIIKRNLNAAELSENRAMKVTSTG